MKFTSNAKWPVKVSFLSNPDNVTSDTHDTAEQAQAICDRLQREGFGGRYEIFPIKTWVEEKP